MIRTITANLVVRLWRGELLLSEELLEQEFEDAEDILPMLACRFKGPMRPSAVEVEFLNEPGASPTRFFRIGSS